MLDENLDHALRNLLAPHKVVTAAYIGWAGLKNGELLHIAEASNIQVLLTGDKTIHHEQNLFSRNLVIIALSAIELPTVRQNLPAIIAAIGNARPFSFQLVDCGAFSRKIPADR